MAEDSEAPYPPPSGSSSYSGGGSSYSSGGSSSYGGYSTDYNSVIYTRSYALAVVAAVFIAIALALDKLLHILVKWLKRTKREHYVKVVDLMKDEMMQLGFASILVSVFTPYIISICAPIPYNNPMLMCPLPQPYSSTPRSLMETWPGSEFLPLLSGFFNKDVAHQTFNSGPGSDRGRRLLSHVSVPAAAMRYGASQLGGGGFNNGMEKEEEAAVRQLVAGGALKPESSHRRILAHEKKYDDCPSGYEPLVSGGALYQVHKLIFCLALAHVFFSCVAMGLALAKLRLWVSWEHVAHGLDGGDLSTTFLGRYLQPVKGAKKAKPEVSEVESQAQHQDGVEGTSSVGGISRSSSVRRRASIKHEESLQKTAMELPHPVLLFLECFFYQFFRSVDVSDYVTIRASFIKNNNLANHFDFHQFVLRSMEHDFSLVVGALWYHWLIACILIVLKIHGAVIDFWASLVALLVVLIVGTKLEWVLAQLALLSYNSIVLSAQETATPAARRPLFWFNSPVMLLHAIHYVLFQSSFVVARALWSLWQLHDIAPCMDGRVGFEWAAIGISLFTIALCSFVALPLYALISHLGDANMKLLLPSGVVQRFKELSARHRHNRRHAQAQSSGTWGRLDKELTPTNSDSSERPHELPPHSNSPEGSFSFPVPSSTEPTPSSATGAHQPGVEARSSLERSVSADTTVLEYVYADMLAKVHSAD